MKLAIFAVILLFGGLGCLSDPENTGGGIVCILIGAAIIAYKIIAHLRDDRTGPQYSEPARHVEPVRKSSQSSKYDRAMRAEETYRPIISKYCEYSQRIRTAKSEAAPWKQPFGPKVDDLIALCQETISLYPRAHEADVALNPDEYPPAEGTYSLFPAAECLIDIFLHRHWYDNALGVIKRLNSLGLKNPRNLDEINRLNHRIEHTQNVECNYPLSMDACVGIVRDRISSENIPCFYPGSAKQFTRTHFKDMCDHFSLRENPEYTINTSFQSSEDYTPAPRYKYSEALPEYIIKQIEADSCILKNIHVVKSKS